MRELIELWAKTLGEPPAAEQFEVWLALHPAEVVRKAILRTAIKNQKVGGTMPQDYRIKYASKTMLVTADRDAANAENRRRLADAMSGQEMETQHV